MQASWVHRACHAVALAAAFAVTVVVALCPSPAQAQGFPSRPITIVVPFNAGTSPDILAREIGSFMQKKLGATVIVENKTGAGTMIASRFVADAAPDGHTLFFNGSSSMLAPELNPVTRGKNYMREATFISSVAMFPNAVTVSASLPVRTLPEYIAYLRAHPGKTSYATPGVGSGPHLQTEWFKLLTKTDMLHVPYKSYDALFSDLAEGRVQMTIVTVGAARPFLEAGKLRVLALTTPQRVPSLDYPTAIEAGLPGFAVVPWVGISGPKGMPQSIVGLLDRTIQEAVAQPAFVALLRKQGLEPMPGNAEEHKAFVERDLESYVKAMKEAGIKID